MKIKVRMKLNPRNTKAKEPLEGGVFAALTRTLWLPFTPFVGLRIESYKETDDGELTYSLVVQEIVWNTETSSMSINGDDENIVHYHNAKDFCDHVADYVEDGWRMEDVSHTINDLMRETLILRGLSRKR